MLGDRARGTSSGDRVEEAGDSGGRLLNHGDSPGQGGRLEQIVTWAFILRP
jgi:hypothetical protein